MNEPRSTVRPASRWSRFWIAFRNWLPKRGDGCPKVRSHKADRRPANQPRLGMESLEQRTTISETVLGLVWPTLWVVPNGAGRATGEAAVVAGTCELRQGGDVPAQALLAAAGRTAAERDAAERDAAEPAPVLRSLGLQANPFSADMLVDPFREPSKPSWPRASPPESASPPAPSLEPAAERGEHSQPALGAGFSEPGYCLAAASGPGQSPDPGTVLTLLVGSLSESGRGPAVQSSRFEVSYQAGDLDDFGNFLGGTEIMNLVPHQGKLFAATSVWMDVPGSDPRIGAQILRLDSPDSPWRLDYQFDEMLEEGTPRHIRVEMMRSFTFTTDGEGKKLPEPVSILLAAPTDPLGEVLVYSRNDASETWTAMLLGTVDGDSQIRAMGFHHDPVTGVDRVFMGNRGGTFSGVYDPSAWGRIRWDKGPEKEHENRTMAFAEANGTLHAAIKPGLFQRIDGPDTLWHQVLAYQDPPGLEEGLRGLTTLPTETGDELLASLESADDLMLRIVPAGGFEVVTELDLRAFLTEQWGGLLGQNIIAGYNDMLPVTDPETGENVHLIGLLALPPLSQPVRSSWYLVRHADASYELHEIPALPHPRIANPFLRGTRSIVVSPFAEDRGQVLYFGGYDCTFLPAHNTAWIYRASLGDVLRPGG